MRRAPVVLLLLPVLAGCGQAAGGADLARPATAVAVEQPGDPVALLAGVPAAAEAAGSVRYSSITEGALEGEPARVEGRLSGELDLTTGAGTGELELPGFADLAAEAEAAGETSTGAEVGALARLRLSWTATDLTAEVDGERHTAPRDSDETGIVGRVPAEPAGLLDAEGRPARIRFAAQVPSLQGRTRLLTTTYDDRG